MQGCSDFQFGLADPNALTMTDPELPLLAAEATGEFGAAIRGAYTDFSSARKLADFLMDYFEGRTPANDDAANGQKKYLDSDACDVVNQALLNSSFPSIIKDVHDVVRGAVDIATQIRDHDLRKAERADLARLQDFFSSLASELAGYRENLIQSYREPSPYRR